MLNRRQFLGAALAAPAFTQQLRRPNILFIMPDQLRPQSLGYMGNKDVQTPVLDKLALESLVLENTFANSPVCSAARATILTGKYPHKNGMTANDLRLRESEVTIAEGLRDAGYRTGFVGKWHLDGGPRQPGYIPPGPRRQGFDFWAAHECSHAHFDNHYFRDTDQPIKLNKFETEGWTDLALEFLEGSRRDNRPFFLTVQMGPPHNPYKAPPELAKLSEPEKLTMRPNWNAGDGLPGPKEIAGYYAMITGIDRQVGRMLKTIDDIGATEDTIVLFSSDHGDMLGSQGRLLKRKPWEESIGVPGLIRYPRRIRPTRSKTIFTHVDFAPTLLGLCGLRPPSNMQGTDLSAVFRGAHRATPDSAFFQIFGANPGDKTEAGWRGVRTDRYMYARFREKPWVLFDVQEDPYELRNLVDDPAAAPLRRKLEDRITRWMRDTGDSWDNNWTFPIEQGGRLYRHRHFYSVNEYIEWSKQHPELDRPRR